LEWRKALRLADHFWAKWIKELLSLLHSRPPASVTLDVIIDDVVIIADDSLPRRVCVKGRVFQLHPGRDGKVRVS
jgi:hypothetical protein